jgi:DNA polymerase III epsilon subunit-like protein
MIALIFDTETTGIPLHPRARKQPRIIEWGGMLVDADGSMLRELDVIIDPEEPLEAIITKITGLTDEALAGQPKFAEVAPQLREMFAAAGAVVAHNLPFDSTMMELELDRAGITDWPWPARRICTVQEHAEEWGRRPKLLELYEHYMGEKLDQKHRALDDVVALAAVARASKVLA